MIVRFVIYGFLGWVTEILWTGLTSVSRGNYNLIGHTSVWMFFIYGFAVVLLEPVHGLIASHGFIVRGIIWTLLIFAVEFSAGMLLKFFGIEAWHYSCPLSVCGVIRLDYAPLWFTLGLVFEKIHTLLLSITINH